MSSPLDQAISRWFLRSRHRVIPSQSIASIEPSAGSGSREDGSRSLVPGGPAFRDKAAGGWKLIRIVPIPARSASEGLPHCLVRTYGDPRWRFRAGMAPVGSRVNEFRPVALKASEEEAREKEWALASRRARTFHPRPRGPGPASTHDGHDLLARKVLAGMACYRAGSIAEASRLLDRSTAGA